MIPNMSRTLSNLLVVGPCDWWNSLSVLWDSPAPLLAAGGDSLVSLLQYCAANIIHILFRFYNNILHTQLPSSFKKYFQFSLHCKIPIKGDRDKWHGVFIKSILKQNISAVTRWGRKTVLNINNILIIMLIHNKMTQLRTWPEEEVRRRMWALLVGGV